MKLNPFVAAVDKVPILQRCYQKGLVYQIIEEPRNVLDEDRVVFPLLDVGFQERFLLFPLELWQHSVSYELHKRGLVVLMEFISIVEIVAYLSNDPDKRVLLCITY